MLEGSSEMHDLELSEFFFKNIFLNKFCFINLTRKLNSKMELKDILKSAREKKSMLMREVAALIDVDTAMISKFEKGDRNPTRNQIEKL